MNRGSSCLGVLILFWSFLVLAGCGSGGADRPEVSRAASDAIERVAEKGPVKLTVRITPRAPRLSDLVDMEIEVTAPPEVEIKAPAFGQAVGDFLVRDYSEGSKKSPPVQPADGSTTRRFRYQLEPVHAGRHLIRSVAIEFVDNRPDSEAKGMPSLIESEPLEVEVTSELGDEVPNLANLEPMLPPRPLATGPQWTWLLVASCVLAAALLIVCLQRRRKSRTQEPRRLTPEEIAHAALAALLSENLPAQGQFKEFYLRLTGIVRHYIEATTGLRAPEQTTEEFLQAIRSREVFPIDRSARLIEFLEAADMVKYAGQKPGDEQIQMSIGRAREFVGLPRPDPLPNLEGTPRRTDMTS